MTDSERNTSIDGPNPDGTNEVEIKWVVPDAGRFGGDKGVERGEASHAHIKSSVGERLVTKAEAEAFIAKSADLAKEKQRLTQELAATRSLCRHCDDRPRNFGEMVRLQAGSAGVELLFGELTVSNLDLEYYVCRQCGSMEFFNAGTSARYVEQKTMPNLDTAPPG
jgi:hypothetical protein